MANSIMFQGTGSDVGKTVLVAGLCRLASNRGIKVLPFKPQNMSNNAAVADDGGEIGRGQWLQAVASRATPSIHMNPVLLKPQSETGSQIVLHGKVWGQARAQDYRTIRLQLLDGVLESFDTLSKQADLILVEGAGSPAEINLRAGDIANMGFATAANVPVALVGDIDRGGVIASLVGTHTILPQADRDMIKAYLINKFRGDVSLFDDGLEAIKSFTGWTSLGIVPWLEAAKRLPAEDSVVLERLAGGIDGNFKIVVPKIPRIANFDDFDPLTAEPSLDVEFIDPKDPIPDDTKLVILPGSKSTVSDLKCLIEHGWREKLQRHIGAGHSVLGVCGGFQMLGRKIFDPEHIEGQEEDVDGLGLLDIETVMEPLKITQNLTARSDLFDAQINGYEIHIGRTTGPDCARAFCYVGEKADGAVSTDGKIMGTYMHRLFDADEFRQAFFKSLGADVSDINYHQLIDDTLDEIADQLDRYLDFDAILSIAAKAGR